MKNPVWMLIAVLAMSSAASAFDGKDDVAAAAKKLADAPNYSWTSTSKNNSETPGAAPPRVGMGAVEGKAVKGGPSWLAVKFGENTIEAAVKGEKLAIKTPNGWVGSVEAQPGQGGRPDPSLFMGRIVKTMKPPAEAIATSLDRIKELKSEGDGVYSGELTEQGLKDSLSPPRADGQPNPNAPQMSDGKGSLKIWIKDGMLFKIETTISGKMKIRDQERAIDRTSTVEIKDVGTTKLELPEEAKKLLE